MSININTHLFTETGTDSDALNVLGTLVHRFPDEGEYLVSVTRKDNHVGERLIVVDDEYHSRQATIDLSSIDSELDVADGDCSCEAEEFQCIRPDGYVVFHVASGPGGYSVVVDPLAERDVREFDSGELTEYDRFAATLMRPGTYTMRNHIHDTKGTIEVAYPDPDGDRPDTPVTVTCTDDEFDPAAVDVVPAQGLVFDIEDPSHVQIELEKPHERATEDADGPGAIRSPRPDRGGQSRLSPDELSIDELETELTAINRRRELRSLLLTERAGENRNGAIRAINDRLRELDRSEGG